VAVPLLANFSGMTTMTSCCGTRSAEERRRSAARTTTILSRRSSFIHYIFSRTRRLIINGAVPYIISLHNGASPSPSSPVRRGSTLRRRAMPFLISNGGDRAWRATVHRRTRRDEQFVEEWKEDERKEPLPAAAAAVVRQEKNDNDDDFSIPSSPSRAGGPRASPSPPGECMNRSRGYYSLTIIGTWMVVAGIAGGCY